MVQTGLELLLSERLRLVEGERIAVLAHPASVDSQLRHIADLFHDHPKIRLTALLGPQHGARGETQDNMIEWEDYQDRDRGLPVYSLYAKVRRPTEEMLSQVDVLVFDLQDVGSRYYTFVWTMALAMQACAQYGKRFVVLDRPNPIGGLDVEGNLQEPEFQSFVGLYPMAVRHGMTVAELARYLNAEFEIGCWLEVVPMRGWKREMFFEQTGLPWVLPSPNMPTVDTAIVYPGGCLLEGTNLSEGRGTTRPFEINGAPWAKPDELAALLRDADLPGVRLRPITFSPTFHKWQGQVIGGVQIHVTDRKVFKPFRTGLALIQAYFQLGPDQFQWKRPPYEYEYEKLPFDILVGTNRLRPLLEQGRTPVELERSWDHDLKLFQAKREQYLLY